MDEAPLEERTFQAFPIVARQEFRQRMQWIGWRTLLPASLRAFRLLLTDPRSRESARAQFGTVGQAAGQWGYALLVGRRPGSS